jgi:hypothetical protein
MIWVIIAAAVGVSVVGAGWKFGWLNQWFKGVGHFKDDTDPEDTVA